MRRLRGWVLVLAIALVATFACGMTQGTPDEMKLRRLAIVDGDGKERIVAEVLPLPNGQARILYFDRDGVKRIKTATYPDGEASVEHYDQNGNRRILTGTFPHDEARITQFDLKGKGRIKSATSSDGEAEIRLYDEKGTGRIGASTSADGNAHISVLDRRGVPGWMVTSQPRGASVLHVTPERYER
jgi:hypothetical protein